MAEPIPDPSKPGGASGPTDPPADSAARKASAAPVRRRHRGLKLLAAFVVALVVIILLLPTIASTGFVRRYAVGKINQRLNGSVEVTEWSLGWTTGLNVTGVRVRDAENVTVLEIARVQTGLTLFNAVRGNYDFGDTIVDDPNLVHLVVDADGRNNLQSLVKPDPKSAGTPDAKGGGSSPLSTVKMNLHVNRPRGSIVDARIKDSVVIDPASDVVLKITGPNDPIQNAITLVFRLGSGTPGTIKLNGAASVGGASTDPSRPDTTETLELLPGVPLAGVGPLLSLAGQSVTLEGTAGGTLAIKAAGSHLSSLDGQITATNFAISGAMLQGQSYRASKLVLSEKVLPAGSLLGMAGGITIDDFVATAAGAKEPTYTEKQLVLSNDLLIDHGTKTISFKEFKLDTVGSDTLHLAVTGGMTGPGAEQVFNDLKVTLGYDWEKIYAIVRPMLSAETREDLKDFAIAGKGRREFVLRGSYPAGKPFNEAVRTLAASGSIAVDQLRVYGVRTEKPFELPFTLAGGQLRTVFADKPAGQESAAPIAVDGGTINLGNLRVDLTGAEPRLFMPHDHPLVTRLTINPLLGDKLGRFINPVFTNSERAKGLLTVVVNGCEGIALSKAIVTANSGSAHVTFGIDDMDLANPFGKLMLLSFVKNVPALGNVLNVGSGGSTADTLDGSIENGVITLDHGRTTQNITMQLVDPGSVSTGAVVASRKTRTMPLVFVGDVNLVDQRMKINATLPAELAAKFVESIPQVGGAGKEIRRALPNGIPFTMTGTTRAPKFDWGDVGMKLASGLLGGKLPIGDLLSPKGDGKNPIGDLLAPKGDGKNPISDILAPKGGGKDPVGDIISGLTGKKKEPEKNARDPNDTAAPSPPRDPVPAETPSPRRGRRARTTAPATTAPADSGIVPAGT